jgi:hypothetical protein
MFPNDLAVDNLSDGSKYHYKLTGDFIFNDPVMGVITAKTGFETDFASVPRFFQAFIDAENMVAPGATIHDWLYTSHQFTKSESDWVLYRALVANGVSHEEAIIFYEAVRFFGHDAWNSHNPETNPA